MVLGLQVGVVTVWVYQISHVTPQLTLHSPLQSSLLLIMPQPAGSKTGKAAKDLRTFFGASGSQPKAAPRTITSQVRFANFSKERVSLSTKSSQFLPKSLLVYRARLLLALKRSRMVLRTRWLVYPWCSPES